MSNAEYIALQAEYERAIAQRDIAEARYSATILALSAVMRTLRRAAGSPAEAEAWARAREVIGESGIRCWEIAEYQAAYEAWEARR